MDFLRKHWFAFGGIFAIVTSICVFYCYPSLSNYQILIGLSWVSLFLHQLEEFRIVGTFPGMVNRVMYKSDIPDRYPLNANTSLYINVFVGWVPYFLAAILREQAVWLGIATSIVSLGNTVAHTIVFNIKGKTIYNAGFATSWLLLVPCIYFFFTIIYKDNLVTLTDYFIGVPLGIILNVIGIIKLIDWLADKNTSYIFEQRNLLPQDRKK